MIFFQTSLLGIYIYVTVDAVYLMNNLLLPVVDSRWDFLTVTKENTLKNFFVLFVKILSKNTTPNILCFKLKF